MCPPAVVAYDYHSPFQAINIGPGSIVIILVVDVEVKS